MTIMKAFKTLLCIAVALIAVSATAADMKFFRKAAERVWKTHPEYFDANKAVPDSIAEGNSAVILMKYQSLNADYERISNLGGDKTFTRRKIFTRVMVKLLDANGVKEFSQHEFGESERAKAGHYTFMKADNAFGARVYKPDGTVTDVDLSEAFAVTEGKKDKEKNAIKRKIDIPGLEPGDVLDYFSYDEDEVQEFDPSPVRISLISDYPIMESIVECRFSPNLTIEYRAFNGAPDFEHSSDDKYNYLHLHRYNLPVLTDKRFIMKAREVPFYTIYTVNNTSTLRFYPYTLRGGGINGNLPIGTVYRDIALTLAKSDYGQHHLPGDVRRIMKEYIKTHPEASREEILKTAWTAAVYTNTFDKKDRASDYWVAVMFADLARKQGWADSVGVGFLNSRYDVPTEKIINWRQPDFGIFADGKYYLERSALLHPAGELPAAYQGERGGAYIQDRENLLQFKMPTVFVSQTTPSHKSRMTVKCNMTVKDDNSLDTRYDLTFSGITKEITSDLVDRVKWASEIEDYLGIPAGKRYKSDTYDAVEREKEIKETIRQLCSDYLYGGDEYDVDNFDITAHGVRPDAPDFKMTLSASMPETVSAVGNDLILSIGRFLGKQNPMTGTDRNRQTDIWLFGPIQSQYDFNITIPDGYEADPASLANLKTMVNNPLGMFYAEAVDNGNGTISLRTRIKINVSKAPIGAWEDFLKINDAETAFYDTVLLLKKKTQ